MEHKKNPSKDLRRWKGALTNFGLMTSIGVVLVAFEWKAYEEKPLIDFDNSQTNWEDDFSPPIMIVTPPPPPIVAPEIKVIDNSEKMEDLDLPVIDIGITDNQPILPVVIDGPPVIEQAPEIVDFTEVMASFQGGMDACMVTLRTI